MYGIFLQRWYAVAFALSLVIFIATLAPTRRRYWCAVLTFTVLAIGSVAAALAPLLFNIFMANAFNPHSVTPFAYVFPVLPVLAGALPALALYPFIRPANARRLAILCFGIPIAIAVVFTVIGALQPMRGPSGPFAGFYCLILLLLWTRLYNLRLATKRKDLADPTS